MAGFSNGLLDNPFPGGKIVPGEEQAGRVVFGVPTGSRSFTVWLVDGRGEIVSNHVEITNVSSCEA
jgi:hypothetical protein